MLTSLSNKDRMEVLTISRIDLIYHFTKAEKPWVGCRIPEKNNILNINSLGLRILYLCDSTGVSFVAAAPQDKLLTSDIPINKKATTRVTFLFL